MVQQKGDDMAGSEQRARHRRLEFVGHPARSVRIELGGRVDEAARTTAPIDESLNESDRKQSERGDAQRVGLAALGSGGIGSCRGVVEHECGHDDSSVPWRIQWSTLLLVVKAGLFQLEQ